MTRHWEGFQGSMEEFLGDSDDSTTSTAESVRVNDIVYSEFVYQKRDTFYQGKVMKVLPKHVVVCWADRNIQEREITDISTKAPPIGARYWLSNRVVGAYDGKQVDLVGDIKKKLPKEVKERLIHLYPGNPTASLLHY